MRIVHFSDLHIGVENYGRPAVQTDLEALPDWFAPGEDRTAYLGHSTRFIDFLCAFDELIAYVKENQVDLVIFSGDAYKNRDPSQTHQREFAKRIHQLTKANIAVFLLVGNHDLPHATYRASALEIFGVLEVPNMTIAETLATHMVQTKQGPIQIIALPWIRRSNFLAREDTRNLPFSEVNVMIQERIVNALLERGEALDASIPSILSAHVSLNTAKLGSERTMMVGYDHILLQSELTRLPVDYIALGHIHRRQKLSDNPPAIYPGSLQRVDFGEEDHEAKGFYVLDLDPSASQGTRINKLTFKAVKARPFTTIRVTIEDSDVDPTATVLGSLDQYEINDAIVRIVIKIPATLEVGLREREIRQAIGARNAHHIATFSKEVDRTDRIRLAASSVETKSPINLIKTYFTSKGIGPKRATQLMTYVQQMITNDPDNPIP